MVKIDEVEEICHLEETDCEHYSQLLAAVYRQAPEERPDVAASQVSLWGGSDHVGPWFVSIVLLAPTTTSSTTTTTLGGGVTPGTPSPGAPVWLVVVIGALGAVATGSAAMFGFLWKRDRAAAGAEIETKQQAMIKGLLEQIEELHNRNLDLHKKLEGSGLIQMEGQAALLRIKDETIDSLRRHAIHQDKTISALEEQMKSLLDMVHPEEYKQAITGFIADVAGLRQENRRQYEYILRLQREGERRTRPGPTHGIGDPRGRARGSGESATSDDPSGK